MNKTLPISVTHPDVAAQWHPERNNGVTPDQVVAGSKKKYWWVCPEGPDHEWDAVASNRTHNSTGCPCCAGYKVSVTNSLASLFPEVAAQLHHDKNDGITADKIVAGSSKKYWWVCPEGPDHEWETTPGGRTSRGDGCPCCAGLQVSVTNSLASLFPEIATQWHPSKNEDVSPEKVIGQTHTKYWWKCDEGPDHEWLAEPHSRAGRGSGCPSCAGQQVSVTNSLASLLPDVAIQLHLDKNGGITADQIVAGSSKKYWWVCPKGPDHEWLTTSTVRTGRGDFHPFSNWPNMATDHDLIGTTRW